MFSFPSTYLTSFLDRGIQLTVHRCNRISPAIQRACDVLPEDPLESFDYRELVYVSACVQRILKELQHLSEKYSDDDFISQLDGDGDNGILLAAMEENGVATVEWLQERGVAIEQANHGRTPLMGAALWGRLGTVQYLTTQGVHVEDKRYE